MAALDPIDVLASIRKQNPIPITLINTRDCFAFDLLYTEEVLNLEGRKNVIKKEYYFDPSIENGYP
jgi:hypothetical protein